MDTKTIILVLEALQPAVVPLGAAFLGAWLAFRLEDNARARQTVRDQVEAVNKALFVLIRQVNSLINTQTQIINPHREDPDCYINMRPSLPKASGSPTLDLDSLSFLLETDDRNLLGELLVEQERFEAALQAMNERSRYHLEILQPRMEAARIGEHAEYSTDKIRSVLGESFVLLMQRATDDAIQLVDKTVESNSVLTGKVHVAMKRRFPKHTIIRLAPKEPSNK